MDAALPFGGFKQSGSGGTGSGCAGELYGSEERVVEPYESFLVVGSRSEIQTANDQRQRLKTRSLMPGKVLKIGTFSDWVGLFDDWRKDIGINQAEVAEFKFDTLYGAIETDEISSATTRARASGKTCARSRRSRCATR